MTSACRRRKSARNSERAPDNERQASPPGQMFTQHHQADALHRDAADHHERHRLCWRQHVQQHRAGDRRECESRHAGYEGAREYPGAEDQERGELRSIVGPAGAQLRERSVLR